MLTTVLAQSQGLVPDADADTMKMQYLSLLPTTVTKSLSLGISFRTVVHVTFAQFCLLPPGVLCLSPRWPWLCKKYHLFQPYWDFLSFQVQVYKMDEKSNSLAETMTGESIANSF
jgi:hypothetical protein